MSSLAVVIPAYNAEDTLPACLEALTLSERQPDEVILCDDGSTDRTAGIARECGVRVISTGGTKQGPATGRNCGARSTLCDIVAFIDADVAVHPDALGKLEKPIINGQAIASFGSYDDAPVASRIPALYANLRHHWIHQHGAECASTFWSGLGAVRREAFAEAGGFDPSYETPSIEDIELGIRLAERGGAIRLVKDALGTHHKDWGLTQLWRTDICQRAIPWAHLIQEGRGSTDVLNIAWRERLAAVCAHLVCLPLLASFVWPAVWPLSVLAAGGYFLLNRKFLALLLKRAGIGSGLLGIGLHFTYHLYASITFALVASGLTGLFSGSGFALRTPRQVRVTPRPPCPDSDR